MSTHARTEPAAGITNAIPLLSFAAAHVVPVEGFVLEQAICAVSKLLPFGLFVSVHEEFSIAVGVEIVAVPRATLPPEMFASTCQPYVSNDMPSIVGLPRTFMKYVTLALIGRVSLDRK